MLPAGFLQEPAVSLLNHIIRIGQHQVGEFKYLGKVLPVFYWYDQRDARSSSHPPVRGDRPAFQYTDLVRVFCNKIADRMIAEPVAGSPVGDPAVDPALEYHQVSGFEPVFERRDPGGDDKRLIQVSGTVQFFTEGKDFRFLT